MSENKPILCLDFDGVIHSYGSGWKGAAIIPDPPVPGAFQFIEAARRDFRIAIFSSRRSVDPDAARAMREWFAYWSVDETYGFPRDAVLSGFFQALEFWTKKPAAFLTIDDRAITFTGKWPEPKELLAFRPWNKK